MKTKYGKQAGSIVLAALLGVSGAMSTCCMAAAEETTEAVTAEAETETEMDLEDVSEDSTEAAVQELELVLGDEILIVTNTTGIVIESVSVEDTVSAEEAEEESENTEEAETEETQDAGTALVFAEEDGIVHTFEIEDMSALTDLSDLTLSEKIGFFFLSGTDADGDSKFYYETADEITLDESVTMYTTGQVTIRENADGSSEALGYADRGSEVEVLGGTSSWFLVSQGDVTGYVAARYLTMDESEALAAVEAEETAQAAAQQAAAAASQSSSGSQTDTAETDDACLTGGVLN